jgi:predicted Zn finger-like uncharacterized protein
VVIRCERCSTLYELDESLLAPTGSQVQCTKCENVFTAYPPRAPGRTLVGVPASLADRPAEAAEAAAQAAPPPPPSPAPVAETPSPPAAAAPPPPAPAPAARPTPPPSVRRTGPAPVYRPPTPVAAAPGAVRSPVLRRDTVGAFEARLRATARWRWLAPALIAAVVLAVVGAVVALGRRGDAGADRARAEALGLLQRDDVQSLDAAVAQLDLAIHRAPKRREATADRVLADVLRAASLAEEADAITARAAGRVEERERIHREQAAGWEEAERKAGDEAAALEGDARGRAEKARALVSGAHDALRALQAEVGETPEVARALAMFQASGSDRERERVHRLVRTAKEKGVRDPWLDLADGWADARDLDRATRERALVRLGALAAARPDLLRGRYLLARAQLSLGRRSEAVATLDGILTANPKHEAARRLREEVAIPVPAPAPPAPPPAAQEPPANPPPRRRKAVRQPTPEASAPATAEEPAAPPPAEVAPLPAPEAATNAPEPASPAPAPVQEVPSAAPEQPRRRRAAPEQPPTLPGGSG